jgi:starch synthase
MTPQGRALRIAMVAAEAFPFAKAGGLGDVVGALPKALERQGARVMVLIPDYGFIDRRDHHIQPYAPAPVIRAPLGGHTVQTEIHAAWLPHSRVQVFLLRGGGYFDRDGIYDDPATRKGYPDEMQRFIFFMRGALQLLSELRAPLDVLHCHDAQTGLVPALLRRQYWEDPTLSGVRTLFTIHNAAYQGIYPRDALRWAGIDDGFFYPGSPFEYWGKVNFMKVGIEYADMISTVSPTYAAEIQSDPEYGAGLEGVLRRRAGDLFGIVNGADYEVWNPETDPLIPANYSQDDLSGKAICRRELLQRLGLPAAEGPVIGVVSRLVAQKGLDLIEQAVSQIAELGVLVLLGEGDLNYQQFFKQIALKYPQRVATRIGFDNSLAHSIEAGCDMFLMPSKYEPCGLNQLYSLRYGTIPIVRATGGLADTVADYDPVSNTGTGFRFYAYNPGEMMYAIRRAVELYRDRPRWQAMMRRAMSQNWSWDASARAYMQLYARICESR